MTECEYCNEMFSNEDAYLKHLAAMHAEEAGPIDHRRLENRLTHDGSFLRIIYYGVGVVIILIALGVILLGIGVITDGDQVHEHGTLIVEVDGERVDFDQQQYHEPERFHFHEGNSTTWHMHPERLTFEEAMAELGMPVTETSITIEGTTYDDDDPDTTITMQINGEPADLDQELKDGDHIEIIVETDE